MALFERQLQLAIFLALILVLRIVPGATAAQPPKPAKEKPPADLSDLFPELNKEAVPAKETPGEASRTTRKGSTNFLGDKVEISVFGLPGMGRKFVYVFDRSLSMSSYSGRPLAAAKAELIDSLQDLESTHQFQIVFYNEKPHVMGASGSTPRLSFGDEAGKKAAAAFVRDIIANGGTQHLDAIRLAVAMQPDVIFFLTDADEPGISAAELARIRLMNRAEATINTIQFGSGPSSGGENFLTKLAGQNHGKYVYIDVSKLPAKK